MGQQRGQVSDPSSPSGPPALPADQFDWRTFDPSMLPAGMNAPLVVELLTFRDHLDEMLADHENRFVVIKGSQIVGYHPDRPAAVDAVFDAYGREPALIKQVLAYEPVRFLNGS